MPKDPAENIDRYKIQGGQMNEHEFQQNEGAMAEEERERHGGPQPEGLRGADEPGLPQNVAQRIQEVEAAAHAKVERRKKLMGTPEPVAVAPAKAAPVRAATKATKATKATGAAGGAKQASAVGAKKTAVAGPAAKAGAKKAAAKKGAAAKKRVAVTKKAATKKSTKAVKAPAKKAAPAKKVAAKKSAGKSSVKSAAKKTARKVAGKKSGKSRK